MSKLLNRYSLLNRIIRNHLFASRIQTYSQKALSTEVSSEPKEDSCDILSYVDISNEFKVGVNSTIRKLEALFSIKKKEAVDIIARNKFLSEVPGKVISDNYKLCQEKGISNETILTCLYILAERFLFEKIYLLQQVNYDLNVLAPLLKLNVLTINRVVTYELIERIRFFSKILEVSEFAVCKFLVKRQFLLSLNLERTEAVCNLLFENGISKKEILKDLWVLRYSIHIIEERIEYAKSQKVEKLKTWMIRGNLDIFDKYIQRKSEYKLVLGDNTLVEYLSKKLDCSIDQAKGLVIKYPALEKRNLKRVQEIIEFLYQEGFTSDDIFRNPKILFFTVDTIKKRLNQVEEHNWQSIGLHVFVKSQKQFNEYCEALVKSKKRKKKTTVIKN